MLNLAVAKNLVLAGVNSMTVMDHEPLTKEDFDSQFLAPRDKLGTNRAEASLERLQGKKGTRSYFLPPPQVKRQGFCDFILHFDSFFIFSPKPTS